MRQNCSHLFLPSVPVNDPFDTQSPLLKFAFTEELWHPEIWYDLVDDARLVDIAGIADPAKLDYQYWAKFEQESTSVSVNCAELDMFSVLCQRRPQTTPVIPIQKRP